MDEIKDGAGRIFPPLREHVENHVRTVLKTSETGVWEHPFHPQGGKGQEEAILNGLIERNIVLVRREQIPGNPPVWKIARGPQFEVWRAQWQRS